MAIVRQVYVISDLHPGGAYGTFTDSDHSGLRLQSLVPIDRGLLLCSRVPELTEFVDALTSRPAERPKTELIINGDFVDFLAEGDGSPPVWTPFVSNGQDAAAKLQTIIARDRSFFTALGRFLEHGHRLVVLLGNHDIELVLPAVRRALTDALHITGRHDFHFIYNGEAYVVGDALIEHGNQYDPWNTVDYESLRKLRSSQSRNQPEANVCGFKPPAGSRLVCEGINPIKTDYPFVDLLKPETDAVIPMLLALEPGYRRLIGRIAALCAARMTSSALRSFSGDIAAQDGAMEAVGGDLVARPWADHTTDRGALYVDPLLATLEEVMPGEALRFLAAISEGESDEYAGDIASMRDTINRGLGLARLLTAQRNEPLERRFPALLLAVRVLQNHRTFDRSVETLPQYLDAATVLSQRGFRFVVFGHTHLARDILPGGNARYLNAGTLGQRHSISYRNRQRSRGASGGISRVRAGNGSREPDRLGEVVPYLCATGRRRRPACRPCRTDRLRTRKTG